MKRYDFKAHFDPYYGCDVAEPEDCSDGDWVPASVAQALYDALVLQTSLLCSVRKNYGDEKYGLWSDVNEGIANGNKALSLADGEE